MGKNIITQLEEQLARIDELLERTQALRNKVTEALEIVKTKETKNDRKDD